MSIAAFADELDRAHTLGLLGVVLHPGTCTAGSEDDALRLVADAIRTAFALRPRRKTMVLLEHTAGQGRVLGWRFEQIATILTHLDGSPRAGVCLDTCHLIASGYDIVTEAGYAETFAGFARTIGFDRLRVMHANDSKKPCASRVDRHEHIGDGCLGLEPFRRLLHDRAILGAAAADRNGEVGQCRAAERDRARSAGCEEPGDVARLARYLRSRASLQNTGLTEVHGGTQELGCLEHVRIDRTSSALSFCLWFSRELRDPPRAPCVLLNLGALVSHIIRPSEDP